MNPFTYNHAGDATEALRLGAAVRSKYLGGGTNLVDLMRENLERPATLVDVTGLSTTIEQREDGGLLIGAGVRNTALAEHQAVRMRYPVLTRAILAGASPQIRNMATVEVIFSSARAAPTSMTMTERAVTSANRVRAATQWKASIVITRSWVLRPPASLPTRQTCVLRSRPSAPLSTCGVQAESERCH